MIGFVVESEIKNHAQVSGYVSFLPTPFATLPINSFFFFFPEEQLKVKYATPTPWPPVCLIALFIEHCWCARHNRKQKGSEGSSLRVC